MSRVCHRMSHESVRREGRRFWFFFRPVTRDGPRFRSRRGTTSNATCRSAWGREREGGFFGETAGARAYLAVVPRCGVVLLPRERLRRVRVPRGHGVPRLPGLLGRALTQVPARISRGRAGSGPHRPAHACEIRAARTVKGPARTSRGERRARVRGGKGRGVRRRGRGLRRCCRHVDNSKTSLHLRGSFFSVFFL